MTTAISCLICNKSVAQTGSRIRKFCSAKCGVKWHNKKVQEKKPPSLCTICGEEFKKKGRAQTCSSKCEEDRKANIRPKYKCRVCKKPIYKEDDRCVSCESFIRKELKKWKEEM